MHVLGILICISGLGCVVVSDILSRNLTNEANSTDASSSDNNAMFAHTRVKGDCMAIGGAFLYAVSNVLQEALTKYDVSDIQQAFRICCKPSSNSHSLSVRHDVHDRVVRTNHTPLAYNAIQRREEFIGYIGMFGTILALVQGGLLEGANVANASLYHSTNASSGAIIGYYIGFILCLFFFYTNTSTFLQTDGDSTLFNLSLLTSDIYAVIFTYFSTGRMVSWLYIVAFLLVAIGLYIYHTQPPPTSPSRNRQQPTADEYGTIRQSHERLECDTVSDSTYKQEIAHIERSFAYNPLSGMSGQSDSDSGSDIEP